MYTYSFGPWPAHATSELKRIERNRIVNQKCKHGTRDEKHKNNSVNNTENSTRLASARLINIIYKQIIKLEQRQPQSKWDKRAQTSTAFRATLKASTLAL